MFRPDFGPNLIFPEEICFHVAGFFPSHPLYTLRAVRLTNSVPSIGQTILLIPDHCSPLGGFFIALDAINFRQNT